MNNRYKVVEGSYCGTSDDCEGRYYVIDSEAECLDKRGAGRSRKHAIRRAKLLNLGIEPALADYSAANTNTVSEAIAFAEARK